MEINYNETHVKFMKKKVVFFLIYVLYSLRQDEKIFPFIYCIISNLYSILFSCSIEIVSASATAKFFYLLKYEVFS